MRVVARRAVPPSPRECEQRERETERDGADTSSGDGVALSVLIVTRARTRRSDAAAVQVVLEEGEHRARASTRGPVVLHHDRELAAPLGGTSAG